MDTVSFRDYSIAEVDTKTMLAMPSSSDPAPLRGFPHRRYRRPSLRGRLVQGDLRIYRRSRDARPGQVSGLWHRRHHLGDRGRWLSEPSRSRHAPHGGFAHEKTPATPHRDITLTKRWMDSLGIDIVCLFPTPMLTLV